MAETLRILALDDKAAPRRALVRAICEAAPDARIESAENAEEVLARDDLDEFDVIFVDIDLPGMSGVDLARELKITHPRLNVVFSTGFDDYMADAFALHSSGYLLKPITADKVRRELQDLRFERRNWRRSGLVVCCFGDFEVFCDGEPVAFGRQKTKELMAYLIDRRGVSCALGDVEAALWGDAAGRASVRSYLRTLIADLRTTLASVGHPDVVVKTRGAVGLRRDSFFCDYYEFLDDNPAALNAYHGEYMRQYSWAEPTLAELSWHHHETRPLG